MPKKPKDHPAGNAQTKREAAVIPAQQDATPYYFSPRNIAMASMLFVALVAIVTFFVMRYFRQASGEADSANEMKLPGCEGFYEIHGNFSSKTRVVVIGETHTEWEFTMQCIYAVISKLLYNTKRSGDVSTFERVIKQL